MVKIALIFPPKDAEKEKLKSKRLFSTGYKTISVKPYPPLGLLSLINAVKNNIPQSETSLLDGQILSKEDIIARLNHLSPDFIGISPSIKSYFSTLEIARFAKSLGSKVILGGFFAFGLAKEILLNRGPYSTDYCIDAIVQKDGEEAICDLIKNKNLREINNLIWQDETGKIIENEVKNFDINKTSFLERRGVDVEKYFEKQQEYENAEFMRGLTVISKKGCAWRDMSGGCIFCSEMNKGMESTKEPNLFWEEVVYLRNHYNANFFWDGRNDFIDNEEWLENLVSARPPLQKLGGNLNFLLFARIDNVNSRTVKLLKNLNLWITLAIGFESQNDKMLKSMNKGSSKKDTIQGVELLKKAGIPFTACFVFGAPGENKETLSDTVNYAKKLKQMGAAILVQILQPQPNTRAFALLAKRENSKYANQDLMDPYELRNDWISNFCEVNLEEISNAIKEIPNF